MKFLRHCPTIALLGILFVPAQAATVPSQPYVWKNVVIHGGGYVDGIITHPKQAGLIYARTDVGGAYRWDAAAKHWVPLLDWLSPADGNMMGVESVGLDPSDPNRLYLAVGMYSMPNMPNGAILRSADQGRHFQRTEMPFRFGGNELGRGNGERLAVDPNDGRIIYFGSRRDDLWKSTDRGISWSKVAGFPHIDTAVLDNPAGPPRGFNFPPQPVGINCVVFDPRSALPGQVSATIYAAVSTVDQSLYRSTDAGATWAPVPGQPTGLRPNHVVLGPDGLMYLSYGSGPGPNSMTDGAVWKYDTASGAWADITPEKPTADTRFGYGAVAVDLQHPSTLMACTFNRGANKEEIFRSLDGGKTWHDVLMKGTMDHTATPWTNSIFVHWMGDLEIDPFNADHVLFTTGYGLWASTNMTATDAGTASNWVFQDEGLEETVPLGLVSPQEGAHLLSGIGDYDGFRHDDLDSTQLQFAPPPKFGNTNEINFAGAAPNVIVRTGNAGRGQARAGYSLDGGTTWVPFPNAPALPQGGGRRGGFRGGGITVSADGKNFVWTQGGTTYFSRDNGVTWTAATGLPAPVPFTPPAPPSAGAPAGPPPNFGPRNVGITVLGDRADGLRFYAWDRGEGELYVSTDGAATFAEQPIKLPEGTLDSVATTRAGDTLTAITSIKINSALYATPGVAGDVWLTVRGAGLFHSTDSGATFTHEADGTVTDARSLGFGKAAAGKTYPALYLIGAVANLDALYRSDDAGATWIRINDDQHQYGDTDLVTGDPRIFGRVYFGTGGRGVVYGDIAK